MVSLYRTLAEQLADLSPEAILAFRVSEADQERADELTERNKEGRLTPDEAQELAEMIEFEEFVSLLKAKALYHQRQLQHP
jgi:hypothetical protein